MPVFADRSKCSIGQSDWGSRGVLCCRICLTIKCKSIAWRGKCEILP